jgi:outer membrane protein assembly factor BamE (lipoprotein component of BamABCDE complex)
MRKAVTVALATAIAASGICLVTGTSAFAVDSVPDGKECTQAEYGKIHKGDSKNRVDRIIGSNGVQNSGGEDTWGYLYGMVSSGRVTTAGCMVTFKQANGHKAVVSKDGWFKRA